MRLKRIYVLLITIVAIMGVHEAKGANAATSGKPENTFQPSCLNVKTFTLDNGMTVWINEDHTQPKVYGAVVVKAGAIDCPNTGIAHYFEHIMFNGTDQLGTTDYKAEKPILDSIAVLYDRLGQTTDDAQRMIIQKEINEMNRKGMQYAIPIEFQTITSRLGGTNLNAETSYDCTVYYNNFTPQYINEWLDLNSHRLIHPVFRMFQSELETVYEEKNMYSDNMMYNIENDVTSQFMKGTPYAYPILGSTENLKNPNLHAMQNFYDKYYVANNMVLILAGDVNADEIFPQIQKTFGRIRKGELPQRPEIKIQELTGQEGTIKMNIPMVAGTIRTYKAPKNGTREALAMNLALGMLNNESKSGLADSLVNDGKLYTAEVTVEYLKYAGLINSISVSLPLKIKRAAAENLLMQQIEKLKQGQFSEKKLNALKLEKSKLWKISIETIDNRAPLLLDAVKNFDFTWQEYMDWKNQIGTITKEEVMDVCRKYFGDHNYYHFTKETGSYPKDNLKQPGYEPLMSDNADKKSVFAQHIDSLVRNVVVVPKLVDFKKDVDKVTISPLVNVYASKNSQNDIFSLSLIFCKGTLTDSRLEPVIKYVNRLGTDKHSRQEFCDALQCLGATLDIRTAQFATVFKITGLEDHFDETLTLLKEKLASTKADSEQYKNLLSIMKTEEESFDRDNKELAKILVDKITYGDNSPYLKRTTKKDMEKMGEQEMLDIYRNLQHTEYCITYSGALSAAELSSKVKDILALDATDKYSPTLTSQGYAEPVVYFLNQKDSRQSILGTYALLNQPQDDKGLATMDVWANYFGSGGSSVLFQEIREMRSMAYDADGRIERIFQKELYHNPSPYITRTSTQADKTINTMTVIDSLWTDMPLRKENINNTKCRCFSGINSQYPYFRTIADYIAVQEWFHYSTDIYTYLANNVSSVTPEDVQTLWSNNVRNANRVWYVVGDKKKIDMKALSRFGKVIELKPTDLYKK